MGAALALLSLLVSVPCAFSADATPDHGRVLLSGTVRRVIDGDTVELQLGARRARMHLHGVEAPERDQPWGRQSTQALSDMVLNQNVDVESTPRDAASRDGAILFVGEEEVGAALVRDGHAWADRAHLEGRDTGLCDLEAVARCARRGLWSQPQKLWVAPWEYRHRLFRSHFTDYSQESAEQCASGTRRKHASG
jgi:endonuclease YncB( thermonuclease family)